MNNIIVCACCWFPSMMLLSRVIQVGECVISKLGTVVDVELSWCKSYVDVCIVGCCRYRVV